MMITRLCGFFLRLNLNGWRVIDSILMDSVSKLGRIDGINNGKCRACVS